MADFQKHSDITPAMNTEWEAKYGKSRLSDLEIVSGDGTTAKFVVRKPDRATLEAMGNHAASKNVQATNKVLISNCVLGGDMEQLAKDGEIYLEVLQALNNLKSEAKSTIKKR
jgi:hypothetical protein